MAVDRLRLLHQQWIQEQQSLKEIDSRSVGRFQILGRLRRLQEEAGQIAPDAQEAFAREFLASYNAASQEEKKALQSHTASPALRAGLMRLQSSFTGSSETSAGQKEGKKPATSQRKSLYEGCNHEVLLPGNVTAIRRIGADVRSRAFGGAHDATALAEVQQAVGRSKSNEVMTPRQATESLLRTAKKLFIRLNDNGRHPKWEKPTDAERALWEEIEGIVKIRMVRRILTNDTDPNALAIKRLVERFVPEGRRIQELQSGYTKWVDTVFHEALAPQEVLREFGEELREWQKTHVEAGDKQAALDVVPAYKYDLPQDQNGSAEMEVSQSTFDLFEMRALVGLALANNNWKLRFKGTDLGQFSLPDDLMKALRDQFSRKTSPIDELRDDTARPMLELRDKALKKLMVLLDEGEDCIQQQTVSAASLNEKQQEHLNGLVRGFLQALKQNSKKLGGAEALSEFLGAEKIIAITVREPKSTVPHIEKGSVGVWEAYASVAAAIISPNQ